jgi:hypothetical protein
VLNSIAASATYSDHLDDGAVRFGFQHLEIHDASVKIKIYSHFGRYSAGDRATPCRAPAAGTSAYFENPFDNPFCAAVLRML